MQTKKLHNRGGHTDMDLPNPLLLAPPVYALLSFLRQTIVVMQ